jgi:AmmeMemoRadiSam system protein B
MSKVQNTRPSAIAGRWYPGQPAKLTNTLQQYLSKAQPKMTAGNLLALIVPHAGYIYSGQTAAYGFKLLENKSFDRVILTSPFHAMTYEALLTTSYSAYETPLGTIPIDQDALERIDAHLNKHSMTPIYRIQREQEHSLEIELPFLQTVLKDPFELVPIMVRTHHPRSLQILADIFSSLAQEKSTLLLASTDLSHFNPGPIAELLDQQVLEDIKTMDSEQLLEDNQSGKGLACGAGAVASILFTAKKLGANHAEILNYTHSGLVTGDNSSVVGYCSAAIYQQES